MRIAPMPWIDPESGIAERIGDALVSAVREALAPLPRHERQAPISLLINLPAPRPGMPANLGHRIGAMVNEQFPGVFDRVGVAQLGHAGAFVGLRSALFILQEQPHRICVVAGADSYIEPDLLEWLERTDQLHSAGERNNAWGFIPGEGAGALLLAVPEALNRLELVPAGRVRSIGVGRETELIGTGTVCLGHGLTEAVRDALGALRAGERVTDVYCDMNGEPYRADEYAFLVSRTREHFVAASEFVSPADCWGDVGAASAPLLIALACIAGTKDYAKGNPALVWASSVTGERGAALLDSSTAARG
jgi:3-oxoacyl-[acyl-carrier-protein] synthase-1